jgi:uncharacterized protein (TIGR03435 family)
MLRALTSAILCLSPVVCGQTVTAPQFEVASIRLVDGASGSSGIRTSHGMIDAGNVTLKRCIIGAYGIGPNQVVGGPDWIDSVRFKIVAKSDQPKAGDEMLMLMLQSLLQERFRLVLHRETRLMPALVLEVGKRGSKLERSEGGEAKTDSIGSGRMAQIDARNTSMDRFANVLSRQMDLPVVNRTGLDGVFNLKLRWMPQSARQGKPADGALEEASIFTAIQEQLGLRLRAQKVPLEVVVIEHAEMPGEN